VQPNHSDAHKHFLGRTIQAYPHLFVVDVVKIWQHQRMNLDGHAFSRIEHEDPNGTPPLASWTESLSV
jgi:hypothetical protein